jgi:hypothetical protein
MDGVSVRRILIASFIVGALLATAILFGLLTEYASHRLRIVRMPPQPLLVWLGLWPWCSAAVGITIGLIRNALR